MKGHAIPAEFQAALRSLQAGDWKDAAAGFHGVLRQAAHDSRAWHFLGIAYLQLSETQKGVDAIRRAVALDATKAAYHNNLGVGLLALGDLDEARRAFERAAALDPRYADAVANLGLVHARLGLPEKAAGFFQEALRLKPGHVDALFNLGNLLFEQGRNDEAIERYRRAVESAPGRGDILNNLGAALLEGKRATEATSCFERALAVGPMRAESAFNAGKAHAEAERLDEARRAFQNAARMRPDKELWRLQPLGLCPTVFQTTQEIDDYRAELERRLDHALRLPRRVELGDLGADAFLPPFNLAHHGRSNRRLLEKFAALYRPLVPRGVLGRGKTGWETRPTSDASNCGTGFPTRLELASAALSRRKTRVGFLVTAPHVGSFLRMQAGIVESLDPERFDVVLLCTDHAIARLRAGIRRQDVAWVPFPRRFNKAVAAVAAAACDVLYFHKVSADPLGYLLPFARLAPVQCTGWTTHFTSGVAEVDYYLSSGLVEADGAEDEYTERLVRLPTFPCYERWPGPSPPASRGDFGLPDRGGLYLCPQRLAKFHPDQDELFRGVLDEDPDGLLVLLSGNNEAALGQLLKRFERTLGSAASRVRVMPPQDAVNLRRLMSVCDALLDIRHYSVSLMAFDAFAAGLPIVTLPGAFKVGRYALGFHCKTGIADLVAATPEEYVRLAVRLGRNRDWRHEMRRRMNDGKELLFEDRQAVRAFEQFCHDAPGERGRF